MENEIMSPLQKEIMDSLEVLSSRIKSACKLYTEQKEIIDALLKANPSRAGEISPVLPDDFKNKMYSAWVEGAASERDYTPRSMFPYPDIFNAWFDKKYPEEAPPTPAAEPVKDNPVEQQDERPGCWDGKCTAPKGAKGITNCLECGGELQQVGNLWYHHSSFDKGRLVAGAQAQDSASSEQLANVSDKERRLAIGFTIWATEQGWLLDPDSEEDEEPDFYKPSDDFDIPDDRMFGGQLYDLYLQHLNGSEMPPTAEHPTHVRDTQNVIWNEIRREMTGQAFSFPRPDIVDEWAGKYTISHKAKIVEEIAAPNTKGDITDDNLKEWAIEESKDLAQRDKDFFFMGVGQLYERLKPQIFILTQQRDEAIEDNELNIKRTLEIVAERDAAFIELAKVKNKTTI